MNFVGTLDPFQLLHTSTLSTCRTSLTLVLVPSSSLHIVCNTFFFSTSGEQLTSIFSCQSQDSSQSTAIGSLSSGKANVIKCIYVKFLRACENLFF